MTTNLVQGDAEKIAKSGERRRNRLHGIGVLVAGLIFGSQANGQNGIITVAGSGATGPGAGGFAGNGGPATAASLSDPSGVAVDASGNLFIADHSNNVIRKVSATGIVTTVAGGGTPSFPSIGDGGPATAASLNFPSGVAVDAAGNLFIADTSDNLIRRVSANGIITTVAGGGNPLYPSVGDGGPATSASLNYPGGIAVDASGNLFIADTSNSLIRKVSTSGIITTVAGGGIPLYPGVGDGGPATAALLKDPGSIAVDAAGNLFIADTGNQRIRTVPASGIITTLAGNGKAGFSGNATPGTAALLDNPGGIAVDASGNLFIADSFNQRIRELSANGIITTVAGNGKGGFSGDDGPAIAASLYAPNGVAVDASGNLFIADSFNQRIREVPASGHLPPPSITSGGIVPLYSNTATIQPGEWLSIYGANLGPATTWNGNFPTSLGGTSVTINGKAAYLWFVSPTQINLQAPDDTSSGTVSVSVTTSGGTTASTVTLSPFGPSFSLLDNKHVAGIIVRSNGSGAESGGAYDIIGPTGNSLGYATVAAKAGDNIELFAVGLGPTNPAVPAGQLFSGQAPTTNPVNVLIDNVNVTPSFAGLAGAGLYQINLTVPAGLGTGDVPLVATVGGVQTPPYVVISLQ